MTALEHVTLVSKYKLLLLLLPPLLSILSLELLSLPQADLYHLKQDLLHLLNLAQDLLHCVLLLKPVQDFTKSWNSSSLQTILAHCVVGKGEDWPSILLPLVQIVLEALKVS